MIEKHASPVTPLPDLAGTEKMTIPQAKKILTVTLKSFAAMASLHTILEIAEEAQKALPGLRSEKETLTAAITALKVEREHLANTQEETLKTMKAAHHKKIAAMETEQVTLQVEIDKRTTERDDLVTKMKEYAQAEIAACKNTCQEMLAEARAEKTRIEDLVKTSEARVTNAEKKLADLKAKL